MKLITTKKIGKRDYTFEFEGENLFECVMESQNLSFADVYKCGLCGDDNLRLNSAVRGDKKYKYTEVKCNKCGATVTFGQRADNDNVYYLRRKDGELDWQTFEKDNKKDKDMPF